MFLATAVAEQGDFLTLKDEIAKKDLQTMCETLRNLLGQICVEIVDNSQVLAQANSTSRYGVNVHREGGGWRLELNNLPPINPILREYRVAGDFLPQLYRCMEVTPNLSSAEGCTSGVSPSEVAAQQPPPSMKKEYDEGDTNAPSPGEIAAQQPPARISNHSPELTNTTNAEVVATSPSVVVVKDGDQEIISTEQ